ncbi:hypothetical protein RB213_011594 [Colletotrichum asianum]
MSIEAFPPELLEHCFSFLPTPSLPAAGHVCRSWWSPAREVQWRRRRIHLTAQTAEKLAVLLGPGTTIPQIVEAICVDEPINDEAIQAFRENVITIMNHFHTRSDLVLDNFGLCNLSESQQQEFLRQARPRRSLIVKWLITNDLSRAMEIVLDQPDISFLGVGLVSVEEPVVNDGAEILRRWKEHKVENTENEIASIAVRLGNLRALCLYSAEGPPLDGTHWVVRKVWSHIVPALSRAKLPMLEILVAESPQGTREKLERLLRATAATLQSLAASFDDPGNLILPEMPCLKNLSINLRPPGRGNLGNTGVASALATISSAPATLEHIFLHLMTSPHKGLIEVKRVEGRSWSRNAFADYDTLCVDDEPKPKHPDPERQLAWHANLVMVMRHFLRTSNLFIQHLDLCCHSGSLRKELLKAARPQKSLSVMYLRIAHIRDALDIMLDQPSISTLALGYVELMTKYRGHECITTMGQDANGTADHKRVAIAISPASPEPVVRLGNLRHICLSVCTPRRDGVWSDIVSALAQARLPKLETLVADNVDQDRGPLLKLIKSTASSLVSLAVIFQHSGAELILPDMPSLTTLSLGLEWSKDDPNILVLPLVTIFSAPTTLKHIFFHVNQDVFESEEEELDSADWEALDTAMLAMPRLSRVAFVVTLGSSVRHGEGSMFFTALDYSEERAREGANDAMRYLEAHLPACFENGIVEVEMTSVSRKFCDDAFLGSDIGPIFWEE